MSQTEDGLRFDADVGRWADQLAGHMDEYLQQCSLEVAENVIVGGKYSPGTPVDEGFARNSWAAQIGEGGEGRASAEKDGSGAVAMDLAGATIATARMGDVVTLSNGAVYIHRLEHGHSQQAPQGMIGLTAQAWPRITEDIARAMGAK